MQGIKLPLQEKECKLYDEFDKFSFVKGETLYQYYWRFAQLINNMNVINMSMRPVQVNTKFLNSLPPEWNKFMTDVKLARDLHTTNYDQLYSYLEQHEARANEACLMRLAIPMFNQGDDLIACLNKAMAFLTVVASSRFPSTNNPFRTSFNPRNQATIQDGRGNATSFGGINARGQARVVKCYNCQGEGHMARKCTQPKRPMNATWFKEKAMLAKAQESGQILDEEQLAFLADPGQSETMVKKRITSDAITEGELGFEHTKKVFNKEVIPFKNSLQTLVKDLKKGLLNELNEVKTVFNQMEAVVDQYVVNIVMHADDKFVNVLPVQNTFLDDNIAFDVMKMENGHLIELLVSQDLVHTAVNSLAAINDYKSMERSYIEEYERSLKLAVELSQMNELSKTCSRLEQQCMSL
ncbi:putative zinc finger, CCHC-type containing protein, partial [Tanacetum coccineum]